MKQTVALRFRQLRRKYILLRLLESFGFGIGLGLVVYSLFLLIGAGGADAMVLGGLVGLVLVLRQVYSLKLHRVTDSRLAQYINRQFPELEWSSDLLVKEEVLPGLLALQQARVALSMEKIKAFHFPHHVFQAILATIIGLTALFLLPLADSKKEVTLSPISSQNGEKEQPISTLIELSNIKATVSAPAYTGLGKASFTAGNLRVAEGSNVSWVLTFSSEPGKAFIVFSGSDTLQLAIQGNLSQAAAKVMNSGFYQVFWLSANELRSSDFFKLEVVRDTPPAVAIANLPQFQQLNWDDNMQVQLGAAITDDYGLSDAYIVATVAKGSGESVKFREEKLGFDSPGKIGGKSVDARKLIDLKKMGLTPGDELYFYLEARDNKTPAAQSTTTETYFIQLKDTASYLVSADGGLGVDLMPEYFRSQRQIIIDSEKLVSERGRIKKQEFDNRSNSLAHDQKVLRLRYGEFLGEEFESGITARDEHEEAGVVVPTTEAEVVSQYGHVHDSENEHNLIPENEHNHTPALDPEAKENPLEAFAHMHDSEEEATFFVQSVKAKLRAALSLMWDAELHLRMNNPELSLPYQHKILKLLKEISNDSRIYVHRSGFDAPPLKEEKRLTGDLSEVRPRSSTYTLEGNKSYEPLKEGIAMLESWMQQPETALSEQEIEIAMTIGSFLAQAEIDTPGRYIESMSLLKGLIDGTFTPEEKNIALYKVRKAAWAILPVEAPGLTPVNTPLHSTDSQLLQQLNLKQNE